MRPVVRSCGRTTNFGALLCRKPDYGGTDQRAEVCVADHGASTFAAAGPWYVAGSNRCLYSNPPGELDAPEGDRDAPDHSRGGLLGHREAACGNAEHWERVLGWLDAYRSLPP